MQKPDAFIHSVVPYIGKRIGGLLVMLLWITSPASGMQSNSGKQGNRNWKWIVDGERKRIPKEVSQKITEIRLDSVSGELREVVISYYYSRGYLSGAIDSIRLTDAKTRPSYIAINRGCQYEIGTFGLKVSGENKTDYQPFIRQGVSYSRRMVEQEIDRVISYYEDRGYPLVEVKVQNIQRHPKKCKADIHLLIHPGKRMRVNGLLLPKLEQVDPSYIRKVSRVSDSLLITPDMLNNIRSRIRQTEYFSRVGEPEIVMRQGKNFLQIPLEEKKPNLFDLVIGYVPTSPDGGTLVGDGRLLIRNVFWPGSSTQLRFERLRRLVTKLHFNYNRNWILGVPLGAGMKFRFLQQDTSYQVREWGINGNFAFNPQTQLEAHLRRKVSVGNKASGNHNNLLDSEGWYAGVGLQYRHLDDLTTPTEGIRLSADLQTGVKRLTAVRQSSENIDRRINQRIFEFEVQSYLPIFRRHVITPTIHGYLMDAEQFTETDLRRFGGTRSIRGYLEDQFRASRLFWGDLEYRYMIDPTTYGFVFGAAGHYRRPSLITEIDNRNQTEDWLYSWGIGFSYNTRLGRLRFSYAISQEDALSNGKVHFGIITRAL